MTFGDEYLTHLRVIQNIGMAGIEPINYQGMEIVPLQFLKAVLPNPGDLGENYTGQTSIGWESKMVRNALIMFGIIAVMKLLIARLAHKGSAILPECQQ